MTGRRQVALAVNALIVVLELWALGSYFAREGPAMLRYYTECSNTLAAAAALACLASAARGSVGRAAIAARRLKFVACCTQLMTLVVVTFVLAPMINAAGGDGYREMFLVGGRPVTHLLGPMLTLASYLAFESDPLPTRRDSARALAFTFAYAVVAYACNFLRILVGPYPFFQVWDMPLWQTAAWFLVLLAVAFGLAQLPRVAAWALAARQGGAR